MEEIEGLRLTPRLERALRAAVEDARARGHNFLGTEHVLLGLLGEPQGIAARVLEQLGVAGATREGVNRILDSPSYIRPDIADPELRQELLRRREVDQAPYRKVPPGTPVNEDFIAEWERIFRDNAEWLKTVIRERGWPGRSLVANDGAEVAWLIAQHAGHDPAFQRDCRELLEEAVAQGEASPRNLAYLTDRVMLNEHGRQRYGTQFTTGPDGPEPFPLEDPERTDELRAGMALEPLAEYAKRFPKPPGASPGSDPWLARLDRELRWWRTFLRERVQDDPEYQERFDPDRHLQPHVGRLLPSDRAAEQVRILDCAAGPATALGQVWHGGRVQLVAVDALAEPYRQILERLELQPPVPSTPGIVEELDRMFAEASFDLVYMRNALDHCRDPRLALEQMLRVARPGGVVLIEHYNQDPRPLVPESLPCASIEAEYSEDGMAVVIRRR